MGAFDDLFDHPPEDGPPPPLDPPVRRARMRVRVLMVFSVALVAVWVWMTYVLPPVPRTYLNFCPPGNTHSLCPNRVTEPVKP